MEFKIEDKEKKQDVCIFLKYLPQDTHSLQKGKQFNFTVKKPGRQPLNQAI